MAKKATQYTREFAARSVRLCDESNRPIAEVARDLGVEYATLSDASWRRRESSSTSFKEKANGRAIHGRNC